MTHKAGVPELVELSERLGEFYSVTSENVNQVRSRITNYRHPAFADERLFVHLWGSADFTEIAKELFTGGRPLTDEQRLLAESDLAATSTPYEVVYLGTLEPQAIAELADHLEAKVKELEGTK